MFMQPLGGHYRRALDFVSDYSELIYIQKCYLF